MSLLYFLFASLFTCIVAAVNLEGKIIPNVVITDLSNLDYTTARVVLNGAQHVTRIKSDGQFTFHNVQPGSYLLEVQSVKYVFPKIRVDIKEDEKVWAAYTALGRDWNQFGNMIGYPFEIQAKTEADYFIQRQGFDLTSMLGNKMFLMMGVSGLMLIFMPKMMKQMQEMNEEMINEEGGQPSKLSETFIKAQNRRN
ncbi:hypothetical protein G6F36_012161 [Rhizopus arrhizus]|nr:hypothetical protein G6F36_012161 [Rhizopus arrhizus]